MEPLRYRPALDGVRGVAVLAVISFHAWHGLTPGGWIGVDIFFVLSGFLITSLLIRERVLTGTVAMARFYARRVLRLAPALAVTLPAAVLIAGMFDAPRLSATASEALSSVFYVSNWTTAVRADQGVMTGLLTHTWSLSIEEQFYIVWPLLLGTLVRAGGRRLALGFTLISVVAIVIHRTTVTTLGHVSLGTDTRADALLVGSALALAWSAGVLRTGRVARVAGTVAAAFLVVLVFMYNTEVIGWHQIADGGYTVIAVAAACVVMGALSGSSLLSWRPLVQVGRISYGLYLFHYPIERVLQDRLGSGPACLALTVVLTVGVASISYRYLEQPFLRLKRRAPTSRLAAAAR